MSERRNEALYQFKITLKYIRPSIWRRIQVPQNYNFWDLHVAIQDAMGWLDCHLHHFQFDKPETVIGIPDDGLMDEETLPGWEVRIADWFPRKSKTVLYRYDFGDNWEHLVQLEKVLPLEKGTRYPLCLGGKRSRPPEDCGGIGGYAEFLEIMANPRHPEHKRTLEWNGGKFDPENFDISEVKFDDPYGRWEIAFS